MKIFYLLDGLVYRKRQEQPLQLHWRCSHVPNMKSSEGRFRHFRCQSHIFFANTCFYLIIISEFYDHELMFIFDESSIFWIWHIYSKSLHEWPFDLLKCGVRISSRIWQNRSNKSHIHFEISFSKHWRALVAWFMFRIFTR